MHRKPLFRALANLKTLKSIHLKSGTCPDYPLIINTPRLLDLLEDSWFNLEELSIVGLKDASSSSPTEEDMMWERSYDDDEEEDEESEEDSEEEFDDDYQSDSDESDNSTRKEERRAIAREKAREKRFEEKMLEKASAKKPRGLKTIKLIDVDVGHDELALIFKHVRPPSFLLSH